MDIATAASAQPLTPLTWGMALIWVASGLIPSIYLPKDSPALGATRPVTWLAGAALGTHLGYRMWTLLPDTITAPQPGLELEGMLLVILLATGLIAGLVATAVFVAMCQV